MNYTNREVIKRLKQYDMFLSSLELAKDDITRERICDQLDKIEKQILLETNTEYEEEYMSVFSNESISIDEEKSRLNRLINIIEDRDKYLEDRKKEHKKVTGSLVELTTFLGEDKLSVFKRRLDIIETYEMNKKEQEKIMNEMKALDIKISEASRNVKSNSRLDDILESKMQDLINSAFVKFDLYDLMSNENEIEEKYSTLKYAFSLAKGNLESAKEVNDNNMISECNSILSEITLEYNKYHEAVYVLKLMKIYDKKVDDYDSLLKKREEIDEIMREIPDSDLYMDIIDELSKELNTIRLQQQDIDDYERLKKERLVKRDRMAKLEEENTSSEFKAVLDELVKNEAKIKEEQIRQAKKKEYQERQERLIEEQKIEASRRRRQKLIEEARMKEQTERINKVKELQDNTILNSNKKEYSNPFEGITIDDFMPKKDAIEPSIEKNKEKSILDELIEESKIDNDFWDDSKNNDLFLENSNKVDLSINFDDIENNKGEEVKEKTKFDINGFDDIPVIENNNLKPELLDDDKLVFPNKKDEEGEILWKETL